MKNSRDIELLSAYLDGQLNPNESARLEARIDSDAELNSALIDIRAARNILRQLPRRKAPRNFTLTRAMVGANPPLPRAHSFFQFSSAFATVLLILTFAANMFSSQMGGSASAPANSASSEAAPMQALAPMAAAATEAPSVEMLPLATASADAATDAAPMAKQAPSVENSAPQNPPEVQNQIAVPIAWQIGLTALAIIGALIAFALRQSAKRKWR